MFILCLLTRIYIKRMLTWKGKLVDTASHARSGPTFSSHLTFSDKFLGGIFFLHTGIHAAIFLYNLSMLAGFSAISPR